MKTRTQFIWPAQVSQVVMERGDRRTTVLWNNSPSEVETSFEAASKGATLVTKYGQTMPLDPRSGRYYVTLRGSTNNSDLRDQSIYLIGGEPIIIDEPVQPLPERVLARIESIVPVDDKAPYEMEWANVSAVLSLPGTNDPVPCRWNPDVQLWGRTPSGRSVMLGSATRKLITEQGRNYPVWEFNEVNVSGATDPEGRRLVSLQIRVENMTTEGEAWVFPDRPPVISASPAPAPPTPAPRIVLSKSCE